MEIIYLLTQIIWKCPGGEIGKRCGLRSRWEKSLESSSLSPGTSKFNGRPHAKAAKFSALHFPILLFFTWRYNKPEHLKHLFYISDDILKKCAFFLRVSFLLPRFLPSIFVLSGAFDQHRSG